jgi:hypothetical protein
MWPMPSVSYKQHQTYNLMILFTLLCRTCGASGSLEHMVKPSDHLR